MPRLQPVNPTNADPKAKTILDGVQKKMGMTPNLMATMANSPAVLEAYVAFGNALGKSALPAKLREQIALTVGELNACQYCLSAHTALGKMTGLGDEEINDSRNGDSPDRKTEAVLQFARKLVSQRGWVSDEDVASLRAGGATDAELAEIVAVVAQNIFSNYFHHVSQAEVDFPQVPESQNKTACAC